MLTIQKIFKLLKNKPKHVTQKILSTSTGIMAPQFTVIEKAIADTFRRHQFYTPRWSEEKRMIDTICFRSYGGEAQLYIPEVKYLTALFDPNRAENKFFKYGKEYSYGFRNMTALVYDEHIIISKRFHELRDSFLLSLRYQIPMARLYLHPVLTYVNFREEMEGVSGQFPQVFCRWGMWGDYYVKFSLTFEIERGYAYRDVRIKCFEVEVYKNMSGFLRANSQCYRPARSFFQQNPRILDGMLHRPVIEQFRRHYFPKTRSLEEMYHLNGFKLTTLIV
ncbi:MAG: hypothetical protein RL641_401 [Candidatus Parcubacteria bacterium]|jgi:hypothetical protein